MQRQQIDALLDYALLLVCLSFASGPRKSRMHGVLAVCIFKYDSIVFHSSTPAAF